MSSFIAINHMYIIHKPFILKNVYIFNSKVQTSFEIRLQLFSLKLIKIEYREIEYAHLI